MTPFKRTCRCHSVITQVNSLGFLPPANEVWGKVIFSQACVIPSDHGGGGRVCIWEGVGQTPPRIGYYGIRSTSGWYASYWNAFLYLSVKLNWFVRCIRFISSSCLSFLLIVDPVAKRSIVPNISKRN